MRAHVAGLCEGLIAIGMWTDVGLTACMIVEMRLQMVFLSECLRTERAAEGLDARVQAMMQCHIAAIRKGLATDGALVWLLSAMGAHVLLEQHFAGESFAAFDAFVRLDARMDAYVHVEGNTLIKRLRAIGAFVFLAISMDFHMAAEVALVVESLATFRTLGRKLFGATMHG